MPRFPLGMNDRLQCFSARAPGARSCSKEEVVEIARSVGGEYGACDVRIAPAFVDLQTRERFREAFQRGDFATWNYGAARAEQATDPTYILDRAKSIICIALAYATDAPRRGPLTGRVSNYAWSHDYHRRITTLLTEIASRIDATAGEPVTAIACDTRPIAERAFAARAGLGWIGKHTSLISPQLGSFVFLGEVITTLDLEADTPLRKTCGTCTRCIDVCPTGALRGDYTMDANLCISDLTQRTDAIPRHLRPLIGEWVWGCDLCQTACPPTQRAGAAGTSGHTPASTKAASANAPVSAKTAAPDLIGLLELRSSEFRKTYRSTGMGWRGAAVLRRNAAVALGNTLDRAAVPALLRALERDPHPLVRGHVAWALGRIGSPTAFSGLRARISREHEKSVREEIEAALNRRPL